MNSKNTLKAVPATVATWPERHEPNSSDWANRKLAKDSWAKLSKTGKSLVNSPTTWNRIAVLVAGRRCWTCLWRLAELEERYTGAFSGNYAKNLKHPCTSLYSDMTWNPPPLRFPNLGKTVFSQMHLPCKCGPWKVNVLLDWTCLEEIAIEKAHSNHSWTMLPAFEGSFRPSQPWGFCTRQKSNCKRLAACVGRMTTVPKCYMVHSNLMTVWWTSRKGRGTTASRFLIVIACAHIQASLTHLSFSNDMIVWNPISTAPASFNRPTLN